MNVLSFYGAVEKTVPRTDDMNEEIRARRRAEIVHAAAPVFARKGLAGTRITDLMEAVGMSQGLLYRYFASKDEVFSTIVELAVQHSLELAQQAQTRSGTPLERLRWFVATFVPPQHEHPEFAMVVAHALTSEAVPSEVREQAQRQLTALSDLIRELIVAGQARGEIIARDAGQLTFHLLATLHGLAAGTAFSREQALDFPDPEILLLALRPDACMGPQTQEI